mgnify:FL=1|tara:strand:+ start:445 stop:2547 length:2103 start_codon:yes stop_codon:yes gene_type:complete
MLILREIENLDNPGFNFICKKLKDVNEKRFCFLKINHGFWERLIKLGLKIDKLDYFINNQNISFSKNSDNRIDSIFEYLANEVLLILNNYSLKDQENGLYFFPSISPWPKAREIFGTPIESIKDCKSLINEVLNPKISKKNTEIGFTGHEFKLAAIQGNLNNFFNIINSEDMLVIFVGNNSDMEVLSDFGCKINNYIEIPTSGSASIRENILNKIKLIVRNYENKNNLLLILSAGGAISTWLGFKLFYCFNSLNIIDMGGIFSPFSSLGPIKKPWSKVYFDQLYRYAPKKLKSKKYFKKAYDDIVFEPNIKKVCLSKLDNISKLNIISKNEILIEAKSSKISFIENKMYDFEFIKSLLSLSEKQNWHANHGPVVRLLEESTHSFLNLSNNKKVVFTNSGTSALEIACGLIQEKYFTINNPIRWIVSSFNFFSPFIGPLYSSIKIDCDNNGLFSLEKLKKISLDSFDGIIYTNVFCQGTNFSEIIEYCKKNNKFIVVDNATGLTDRCGAEANNIPEILSFHHTKPWGFGEGGAIICDKSDEKIVRQLINFGADKKEQLFSKYSGNKKISDISAAVIQLRLATYNQWNNLYKMQERRIKSLISDYSLPLKPLLGNSLPNSPRAFTPFLADQIKTKDILEKTEHISLRKYYKPFLYGDNSNFFPIANDIYDRIICVSNNPNNALKKDSDIINDFKKINIFPSK